MRAQQLPHVTWPFAAGCAGEEAELRQRLAAAQECAVCHTAQQAFGHAQQECGHTSAAARFRAELQVLEQEELDVKMSACAAIHDRMNEHSFGFETVRQTLAFLGHGLGRGSVACVQPWGGGVQGGRTQQAASNGDPMAAAAEDQNAG